MASVMYHFAVHLKYCKLVVFKLKSYKIIKGVSYVQLTVISLLFV